MTLSWPDWPDAVFHFVWLRDNCRCPRCYHPVTRERILFTQDIPADVAPRSLEVAPDGTLRIVWEPDGHVSAYPEDWLRAYRYPGQRRAEHAPRRRLWGGELNGRVPAFEHAEVVRDDRALLGWCEALRDYGVALLHGVPSEHGEVERFVQRIAFVRETVYDRLHEVYNAPDAAYSVASTSLELKPHTDFPNYAWPPSIQLLHFMKNEAKGGESVVVDGFRVAQQLKGENPGAYELLSHLVVDFRQHSDKGDISNRAPLLQHDADGELAVVRYSNQMRQPLQLAPEMVEPFYDAYRALSRLIDDPANQVVAKLASGDLLTTHNHRVLHGRKAFESGSGERWLQLSYMEYDDLLSRIRLLRNAQVVPEPA